MILLYCTPSSGLDIVIDLAKYSANRLHIEKFLHALSIAIPVYRL